ncbi:MAG: FHA domain-containing protein, partial [Ktedonobacteraceae bacterium]
HFRGGEKKPKQQPLTVSQQQTQPVPPKPPGKSQAVVQPQPQKLARLVLLVSGQTFSLHAAQMLVGRSDPRREVHPDILIQDDTKTVGRIHACLSCQQGAWSIEDRDSRNKTRLNGDILIPFTPKPLKDGDLLRFGRVEARFELR